MSGREFAILLYRNPGGRETVAQVALLERECAARGATAHAIATDPERIEVWVTSEPYRVLADLPVPVGLKWEGVIEVEQSRAREASRRQRLFEHLQAQLRVARGAPVGRPRTDPGLAAWEEVDSDWSRRVMAWWTEGTEPTDGGTPITGDRPSLTARRGES